MLAPSVAQLRAAGYRQIASAIGGYERWEKTVEMNEGRYVIFADITREPSESYAYMRIRALMTSRQKFRFDVVCIGSPPDRDLSLPDIEAFFNAAYRALVHGAPG